MFKADKDGIVRVEGMKNILIAHNDKGLLEVGGNADLEWADFKVIKQEIAEKTVKVEPVKKVKKVENKKDEK